MSEPTKNKKETMAGLVERFPSVAKFEIEFKGQYDGFDGFYGFSAYDADGKMNHSLSDGESEDAFMEIAKDYIWYVIENAQNEPNFNDDGSNGMVTFDMVNKVVILQVNYLDDMTDDYDGDQDDPEYDEKYQEYWDNVERDYYETPMPPEIF